VEVMVFVIRTCSLRFLSKNSYEINASNSEVELTMVKIAEKHLSLEEIAAWIKKNSKKIGK
jgi:prophage maintenance system killer protein